MSEEAKSNYVSMGDGPARKGAPNAVRIPDGLDDPNLSQEDRDLRLAIALQQQENASAYDSHRRRHDQAVMANKNRTTRSNTFTRLAQVRKKDHGVLSVPEEYSSSAGAYVSGATAAAAASSASSPLDLDNFDSADAKLAAQIQRVEQASVGTASAVNKILKEEKDLEDAQKNRTQRENFGRGFA